MRPSDAFSFPVVNPGPFQRLWNTAGERALTLSVESCSIAVDRNAASEIWYVLRDSQGEPEVWGCPVVFRNSSQGGCVQGRGGWSLELQNSSSYVSCGWAFCDLFVTTQSWKSLFILPVKQQGPQGLGD